MIELCLSCSKRTFLNLAYFFSAEEKLHFYDTANDSMGKAILALLPYKEIKIKATQNPWQELKAQLPSFDSGKKIPKVFGYLSYEMGAYSDATVRIQHAPSSMPLAHFICPAIVLQYQASKLKVYVDDEHISSLPIEKQKLARLMRNEEYWLKVMTQLERRNTPNPKLNLCSQSDTQKSYMEKVGKVKAYILEGDIYQANISQEFEFQAQDSGFDFFSTLTKQNPTSFASYIHHDDYDIISLSPERFLSFDSQKIMTQPIKGTVKRSPRIRQNQQEIRHLLQCAKENAELMMITDLMRNDLAKVSHVGTVICKELKELVQLSNVFHLQSTVTATPLDLHPLNLIQGCFPPGSISGCPKLKAQQVIHEIEERTRDVYCGSIGYFNADGSFDFCVAIRTAILQAQRLRVQLGGGITVDSDPYAEFLETQHKGAPFFKLGLEANQIKSLAQ